MTTATSYFTSSISSSKLRSSSGAGSSNQHRKSAVELLAETKAFYVKSETVRGRTQTLPQRQSNASTALGGVSTHRGSVGSSGTYHLSSTTGAAASTSQYMLVSPSRSLPPSAASRQPLSANRRSTGSTNSATSDMLQATLRKLLDCDSDSKENISGSSHIERYVVHSERYVSHTDRYAPVKEYCTDAKENALSSRYSHKDHCMSQTLHGNEYCADSKEMNDRYMSSIANNEYCNEGKEYIPSIGHPDRYMSLHEYCYSDRKYNVSSMASTPDYDVSDFATISPPAEYAITERSTGYRYTRSNSHSQPSTTAQQDVDCGYDSGRSRTTVHKSLPDLHTRLSIDARSCEGSNGGLSAYSSSKYTRSTNRSSNKSTSDVFTKSNSSFNRDSGDSSGHYTHKSEPVKRIEYTNNSNANAELRRDSGSSTQHSGNSASYYKMTFYDNAAQHSANVIQQHGNVAQQNYYGRVTKHGYPVPIRESVVSSTNEMNRMNRERLGPEGQAAECPQPRPGQIRLEPEGQSRYKENTGGRMDSTNNSGDRQDIVYETGGGDIILPPPPPEDFEDDSAAPFHEPIIPPPAFEMENEIYESLEIKNVSSRCYDSSANNQQRDYNNQRTMVVSTTADNYSEAFHENNNRVSTNIPYQDPTLSPGLGTFKRQKCLRYKHRSRDSSNNSKSSNAGDRKPILRSKSDISDRYFRSAGSGFKKSSVVKKTEASHHSLSHLEQFFEMLGLNSDAYENIFTAELNAGDESPVYFSDVSTVDSNRPTDRSTDDCCSSSVGNTGIFRSAEPPSIVERNARIIKWLCNCRKAQLAETGNIGQQTGATSAPGGWVTVGRTTGDICYINYSNDKWIIAVIRTPAGGLKIHISHLSF